jgi:DNA-directed RNA polymerase specialized sigma24 family protein
MAAATVPMADFTPYLLQQTALRASLLQTSFGFAADDWEDLRQELALDCLRRLPWFDRSRGNWQGFVRGTVRHHACVLASRQIRRPAVEPLPSDGESEANEVPSEDFWPLLELGLDTERVLAGLPEDLRRLAHYLAEMPVSAVRRRTGLSAAQINQNIRRIRAAFVSAGIQPRVRRMKQRPTSEIGSAE